MTKQVYFIGAGPGDPDLITVKGKKIVEASDVIIYAGSLVNPAIIACAREDAVIFNSASMTLEEVLAEMDKAVAQGKKVARVHTGDPSIYGAIREQMDALEKMGISFEVVPGVSSFTAAAAAIQKEFTLPGVSQTIICTRLEGRTPVPEGEALEKLASHQASMAIFLSVQDIQNVVERLTVHYPKTTPVAIVEKATWPEQQVILGTLEDIAGKVKEAGISKTAQILVGNFLGDQYELSLLYDKHFTHMFREGITP